MRFLWVVTVSALSILPATASPAGDALTAVTNCMAIAGTDERLQCFDAAAATASKVLDDAKKQAAAQQQPESEGGLLSWFGFAPEEKPVTKPEDFGAHLVVGPQPGSPQEITEISSKVIEFAQNAHGKSIFVLENGQVWRQVDGDTTELYYREADGPMTVRIEKALFGSFSLHVEGKTSAIKVRRVK
ncbi:MAG: hypothetical protein ABL973_13005 [Micropepsaceae bacterium]